MRGSSCPLPLLLVALSIGCATSASVDDDIEERGDLGGDLAAGEDLAMGEEDLAMSKERDLAISVPPDLAMPPPDLSMRPDLAMPPPDLAVPPDLAMPPDMARVAGCEVVPQAGCPPGQKCTTHDAMTTICDPNGTVARGMACMLMGDVDNCAAGSVCIDEGAGKSQCRAFCQTDAHCANARSFCDFDLGSAMKFKVCSQPCNAIYPGAGCAPGMGCYAYGREHTDCRPPGTRDAGMPCASAFDCRPGMTCVGPAGASLCRRVCRKGDDSACGGLFCFDLRSGTFNWPTYGACCPLLGC